MHLRATAKLAQLKGQCAKGPDAAVAKSFPKLASLPVGVILQEVSEGQSGVVSKWCISVALKSV